ncbi:MAG TPA: Ig-like domain-containing protein [Gemmatimonadales bacterium]
MSRRTMLPVLFPPRIARGARWSWLACVTSVVAACTGTDPSEIVSVTLSPATVTVAVGATVQLGARLVDADGSLQNGVGIEWTSSVPAAATVSSGGLVTGIGGGTVTITATVGSASGQASVVVGAGFETLGFPAEGLSLDALGATATLTAQPLDAGGNAVSGIEVRYASSDPLVATVSTANSIATVTAISNGTANVIATAGGASQTVPVTVSQVAVGFSIGCPDATLEKVGETIDCGAVQMDRLGNDIEGAAAGVSYGSSNTAAATVDADGIVTAVDNGSTTISVTGTAGSGSADIAVDLTLVFGDVVTGAVSCGGCTQSWTLDFAAGSTQPLVAWAYPIPIQGQVGGDPAGGIDPELSITNASGTILGEAIFAAGIEELVARTAFDGSANNQLILEGLGTALPYDYALGLPDCRELGAPLPGTGWWNTGFTSTTIDCVLYNGAIDPSTPVFTTAGVWGIDLINAGEAVVIDYMAGCSPDAIAAGSPWADICADPGTLDPFIHVFGPLAGQVWWDDDGAGLPNSRITFTAPTTGAYTVILTAYDPGQAGGFTFCTYMCVPPGPPPAGVRAGEPGASSTTWRSRTTMDVTVEALQRAGIAPASSNTRRRPRK